MYLPKTFKCVMPVGLSEITSNLGNNMKYGIYQIASKTFLAVYKTTVDGIFEKGYLTDNSQCNLQQINKDSQNIADLSTVYDNCINSKYKIATLTTNPNNIILDQTVTLFQNGTANILNQTYEVTDNRFALNSTTHYLGLEDCSTETAISTLQQYKDYLSSLIPTTTTTESPITSLKSILDSFTTTESPNEDANDGGYTTYIVTATIVGIALGTVLGYGIKYGIDRYKGKNKEKSEEFLRNKATDPIHKICENYENVLMLIKKLEIQRNIDSPTKDEYENEEYDEITNDNQSQVISLLQKLQNNLEKYYDNISDDVHKLITFPLNLQPSRTHLANLRDTLIKIYPNDYHYDSVVSDAINHSPSDETPTLIGNNDTHS